MLDWQQAAADPAIMPQQVKPIRHNTNGKPIITAMIPIQPPASAPPMTIEQFFNWNKDFE